MNELTLRQYRAGDCKAMYALDLICFEAPFRFSRRAMRGFAEARNAITVLLEQDELLVAFCVAHVEEQMGYVVTLDVSPEWRRKGLAERLMAEVEACALASGARGMALHVFCGNAGAVALYEALHYRRTGIAKNFYGRGLDAFVYAKQLVQAGGE